MTTASWASTQAAFTEAAQWYVGMTSAAAGRWDAPGLDEWTVRDLVGHTSRALLTVEAYLAQPAARVEVTSPADYFVRAMAYVGEGAAVAQRGRDAGTALGTDIPAAVAEIATRVVALIAAASPDALVATPVGGMRLADYLPSRTFELVVHTCDLATALGLPLDIPALPALHAAALVGELAAVQGRVGSLLLAATGRGALPAGFTVL